MTWFFLGIYVLGFFWYLLVSVTKTLEGLAQYDVSSSATAVGVLFAVALSLIWPIMLVADIVYGSIKSE